MRAVVLDTDVFSTITEDRPGADELAARIGGSKTLLAFPSVAELTYGASLARWGTARLDRLNGAIKQHGLLVPNKEILQFCGLLRTAAVRLGHPLGQQVHANDLWVAACAAFYGLPLLTVNERHFVGLPTLEVLQKT